MERTPSTSARSGQWLTALLLTICAVTPGAAQHAGPGRGSGSAGGRGAIGHPGGGIGSYPGHSYRPGSGYGSYSHTYGGWPNHFGGGTRSRYYPHGGWVAPRHYYYYPRLGFGLYGLYSWSYGSPYRYSYPYTYYSPAYPGNYGSYYGYGSNYYDGYGQGRTDERRLRDNAQSEREAILTLRIEPKDAALYLDGNPIGTAEHFSRHRADLRLPPGRYYLEAALAGYTPLGEVLELKAGQTLRIERQLEKSGTPASTVDSPAKGLSGSSDRAQGQLILSAVPGDARVLLDGRFLCLAEMVADNRFFHRIPAGPHTLEVSRDGYRSVREDIIVSPLRPVERRFVLVRQ